MDHEEKSVDPPHPGKHLTFENFDLSVLFFIDNLNCWWYCFQLKQGSR